jgi:hypothetical protein
VQGAAWHGPDADAFRQRWETWRGTAGSTAAALRADGEEVRTHAEQQEGASSADDASGGSEGSGGSGDGSAGGGAADEKGPEDGPQVQSFFGGWADGGAWIWQKDRDLEDDIPLDDPDLYGLDSMNQAGVGNCQVVATLGALSEQDPEFIQEHIRRIDDETYEVTLYDENGDPVVYVVEDRLTNKDPMRGADGKQNWMSIYEDALIQHGTLRDGTETLAGGEDPVPGDYKNGYRPDDLSATITGERGDHFTLGTNHQDGVDTIPSESLVDRIERGESVVLGTDDQNADFNGRDVAENHAYVVESVNPDGTVTVVNPWGADGRYPDGGGHRMDIPVDELHMHFDQAWTTPPSDRWGEAA